MCIAMHQTALRPGEATESELDDVTLPEEALMLQQTEKALIRVAPGGRPAKVGRPQPAECDAGIGVVALRALKIRARRHRREKLYPKDGVEFALLGLGWRSRQSG